ncbi:MAG: Ku protein [Alphaproteobacteria bacterium]
MAPRPYWKGYLKLSLVSCPIALHTATSGSERVAFRQINKVTGNRLRQQLVDEVTREPVDAADKGRGYEYAKGQFIQVEDEELDAVAIESNHTIEIDKFVPHAEIDERYFDATYYITPNDQVGQEAFAVIREAMRGKEMVALGRVVLAKRERVIMLQPWEKGLMGTTLRYAYEVRPAAEYFDEIPDLKISKEMLQLAEHILETKEAEFDPATFVDDYEKAVVEMLQQKQAGIAVPTEKAAEAPRNVINLMDALRRSVESGKRTPAAKGKAAEPKAAAAKAAKGAAKKGKKTAVGQREMLLPIAGKGQGKAAAKEAARESAKPAARRKAS